MRLVYDDDDDRICGSQSCCSFIIFLIIALPFIIGFTVAYACSPYAKRYYLD